MITIEADTPFVAYRKFIGGLAQVLAHKTELEIERELRNLFEITYVQSEITKDALRLTRLNADDMRSMQKAIATKKFIKELAAKEVGTFRSEDYFTEKETIVWIYPKLTIKQRSSDE